jgi:catechol 2,3-dioxygenase-like lactoylglutathione lyase family enzyme
MIENIRHTAIIVGDLIKSLKFYRDILELKFIVEKTIEGEDITQLLGFHYPAKLTYIKLATKWYSSLIELIYFHTPPLYWVNPGSDFPKYHHIALTVDNLDKLIIKLKRHNIKLLSEPKVMYNCKLVFCRDFEGNLIELVEELKK